MPPLVEGFVNGSECPFSKGTLDDESLTAVDGQGPLVFRPSLVCRHLGQTNWRTRTGLFDVFGNVVSDATCRTGEHRWPEVALEPGIDSERGIVEQIQRLRGTDVRTTNPSPTDSRR